MASLVPDYGTSDSDSGDSNDDGDESDSEKNESQGSLEKPVKLPRPSFTSKTSCESSVFRNPYAQAENAETAALEHHVKMIPTKENIKSINGKKICWMYRKGRCRFGHNCKYAHDSDLFNGNETSPAATILADEHKANGVPDVTSSKSHEASLGPPEKKRKKGQGLVQGLVPGKKIMKMYMKQKGT